MQMFVGVETVYLHREPVDFRKSINGLSVIVESTMQLSALSGALFLFCNRRRDKVKLLYWDQSGFCLWYKRNQWGVRPSQVDNSNGCKPRAGKGGHPPGSNHRAGGGNSKC